jgi:hypothetical protein
MTSPSLAYLLVALCHLQPEADYYALQLNLPCPSLVERTNIDRFMVLRGADGLAGYILTSNYIFHFTQWGQLDYTSRRRPEDAEAHIREFQNQLAKQFSEMDSSGAHQLATQWLDAVGVDVNLLERDYAHDITHPTLDRPVKLLSKTGKTIRTTMVPDFWVTLRVDRMQPRSKS